MPYFTLFLLHNYFEVDSQSFECNIDSHLLHFSQGVWVAEYVTMYYQVSNAFAVYYPKYSL